ncbi:DUF3592 domain-containing protein [Streptomyces sp. NPDC002676]
MSQILNGRGSSAQFDADGVHLELRRRRVDIPLVAIREVRTTERVLVIVLTDGATHRVQGDNPTATAAFATALTAKLPLRRDQDSAGSALVTTTEHGGNADGWAFLALLAAFPLAYIGYAVWVGVTHGARVLAVIVGTLPLGFGLGVLFGTGEETFRRIVLARRGITVIARAVGTDGKKTVYQYSDAEGRVHKYRCGRKAQRTQLAYDPLNPERAAHAMWPPFAVIKLLTLFCGSLFWLYVGGYLAFSLLW